MSAGKPQFSLNSPFTPLVNPHIPPPEPLPPQPVSYPYMDKLQEYGDDDHQSLPVAAERRLWLAVFRDAFLTLCEGNPHQRADAIAWFRGYHEVRPAITFQDFMLFIGLKASRLQELERLIKDHTGWTGKADRKRKPKRKAC